MDAGTEIKQGERFAFGENWQQFLDTLTDERVTSAEQALTGWLGDLTGLSFLDVGSGSGLSSLAAANLGAPVTSFDYDPRSVACTAELKRRYRPDDPDWRVEEGSALDTDYLTSLGQFDVVYSWGVLHHTGSMWAALANMVPLVKPGGRLYVAIYNDQGRTSRNWKRVKQAYNRSGPVGRRLVLTAAAAHLRKQEIDLAGAAYRVVKRLPKPVTGERGRGMDKHRDLVDWVGGWPFEVAKPEEIFELYRARGFTLDRMFTCGGGLGCNELLFTAPSH